MSIARNSHEAECGSESLAGPTGRDRAADRKRRTLRAAVTTTVTGLALTVPLGSTAFAALNPTALKSLHLDTAMLEKVQAYDKYRTREASQRKRARKALRFARQQIGKPYRWGAAGPSGYDCSGLMMAAWRRAGVKIPRVTYAQYRQVDRKVGVGSLKPGDLIFFHGRSHVGMYVGHGRFLHAPNSGSRVRIDKFGAARKKQFAGAVRPGAPAFREWSPSVRELVEKIDRMSAQKRADQPPDSERTPQTPPQQTQSKKTDNPPTKTPGHIPAGKAAPPGGHSVRPDDSAAKAPRSDGTPSDHSKPEPRPRAAAHPRTFWDDPALRPWAEYVRP